MFILFSVVVIDILIINALRAKEPLDNIRKAKKDIMEKNYFHSFVLWRL